MNDKIDQNTNFDQFSQVPNGFSLYKYIHINFSIQKVLQNCSYFLSVLSAAWNSTTLILFLKVKLTKTHIEPNFNCKRLQKWQQTWWSFFGLYKNNWNSQIHPGNTKVRIICLHLWHASLVVCHDILSQWPIDQSKCQSAMLPLQKLERVKGVAKTMIFSRWLALSSHSS